MPIPVDLDAPGQRNSNVERDAVLVFSCVLVLDDDGMTRAGTVARAFHRVADFGGEATRGEFRSDVATCSAVWLLVRAAARPHDLIGTAVRR